MPIQAHAVVLDEAVVPTDAFAPARESFDELSKRLVSPEAMALSHGDVEDLLERESREMLRRMFQAHVDVRGPGEVADGLAVVGADGVERTHLRDGARPLKAVFGDCRVSRIAFGQRGCESLHPKDADLNLPPEEYSHGLRRRLAEEVCDVSFERAMSNVEKKTGVAVPKRQAEELVARAAQDFEDFYLDRSGPTAREASKTGPILVITGDEKGVRMHRQDLRLETRKKAEAKARRPATFSLGLPKSPLPKRDGKRNAMVAAVYTIQPYVRTPEDVIGELNRVRLVTEDTRKRPRPESKRVWASVERGPCELLYEAFDEGSSRDPKRNKRWVGLVDGDDDQLKLILTLAVLYGVQITVIVDLLHVAKYVWDAAFALHGRGTEEATRWVYEHLLDILRGKASLVAAGIRRSATMRKLSAEDRKPVDLCADYLLKYAPHLRYDEYLRDGLPIATGVIEGACRYLVKDRLEITGAVWRLTSAEAVLRLRSLRASGDLDEYWRYHDQCERARHHASHYRDGVIPAVKHPEPGGTAPIGRPERRLHAVP